MRAVAIQDIKRRGISFLDQDLKEGVVHVIKNNRPQYVILSEEHYQDICDVEAEAYLIRIKESLQDVKAKRIKCGIAQDLIKELGLED